MLVAKYYSEIGPAEGTLMAVGLMLAFLGVSWFVGWIRNRQQRP